MKKTIKSLLAIAVAAFAFTACSDVPEPYAFPSSTSDTTDPNMGKKDTPYDVASAIKVAGKNGVYVKGFIVGYALYTEGVGNTFTFGTEGAQASNFLIAATPDETNSAKCMPVALPTGDVRNALNLKDHPENLKKEINLYGDITKYFGQTGIKEVSYAILDGKDIGTDPGEGGGEEKADQPKGTGTKDNPFNVAAAVAKCKEVGTTATSEEFYVQGVVAADASVTDASYKNITFEMVDEGFTQIFTAFRVLGPDGKKLKLNYTIPKGAKVVVCGKLVNYNDKTPEIQQTKDYNGTLISVNGQAPELDDGQGGGNDPQPVVGDNLLINGDFETWTQSEYPDNWKTETTAGNATLSKSSNAHGGLASVQMASNTSNKRLGYKEMTLKAGTYTMTFYAKSADADKTCSVACGYASIDAENKLTYVYKTGSDSKTEYTTATNSDWTQITNTFTLSADTKLSIIVMNKGGLGSLLVDDFTLATNDGGIVDGGGESGGGGESTPTINKGTEANPLTVAGAFALIDSQGSSTTKDCYVKGIISKVDNYNSTYKSITYWISEDGNTTGNQLQVYSGKGLNGADFASKDDLTTGKTVVIKGNLKKYNTTYEFDKTSSIISIK